MKQIGYMWNILGKMQIEKWINGQMRKCANVQMCKCAKIER
jgi:hypothetical protein